MCVGKDLIGLAQTGSGKTGAFALPILHALLDCHSKQGFKSAPAFFALVLSPTRSDRLKVINLVLWKEVIFFLI